MGFLHILLNPQCDGGKELVCINASVRGASGEIEHAADYSASLPPEGRWNKALQTCTVSLKMYLYDFSSQCGFKF